MKNNFPKRIFFKRENFESRKRKQIFTKKVFWKFLEIFYLIKTFSSEHKPFENYFVLFIFHFLGKGKSSSQLHHMMRKITEYNINHVCRESKRFPTVFFARLFKLEARKCWALLLQTSNSSITTLVLITGKFFGINEESFSFLGDVAAMYHEHRSGSTSTYRLCIFKTAQLVIFTELLFVLLFDNFNVVWDF